MTPEQEERFHATIGFALFVGRDVRWPPDPALGPDDRDQEALLALWDATLRFREDGGASFRSWVRHIVHERLRRRAAVRWAAWERTRPNPSTVDLAGHPGFSDVRPLLSRLSERQRRVAVLSALGFRQFEVARIEGVASAVVSDRLQQAGRRIESLAA